MTPKTLAHLLTTCITPIKILKDLGFHSSDICKELVLKNQQIIDSQSLGSEQPPVEFYIRQKYHNNTIKFCWKFPYRREQLIIETTDDYLSVYFQVGSKTITTYM